MTPNLLDELEVVVRVLDRAGKLDYEEYADGKVVLTGPKSAIHALAASTRFLRTHAPALADMAKRIEAAERDARRYEWLRYAANVSWNDWVTYENLMATEQERAEMDAAIDRAMEISPLLPVDDATQEGEG